MYDQLRSLSRTLLIAGTFAGMALASSSLQAQNDPPPGSARLAHLQGNVSFQPDDSDSWGQADNNMPIGSGDLPVPHSSVVSQIESPSAASSNEASMY